jgi:hypothetical protein
MGQAQKYTSRATSLAYASVIFTRASGPGGIARDQLGDGATWVETVVAEALAFVCVFILISFLVQLILLMPCFGSRAILSNQSFALLN